MRSSRCRPPLTMWPIASAYSVPAAGVPAAGRSRARRSGGAQLVTHPGQELVLRLVGRFGSRDGVTQRRLDLALAPSRRERRRRSANPRRRRCPERLISTGKTEPSLRRPVQRQSGSHRARPRVGRRRPPMPAHGRRAAASGSSISTGAAEHFLPGVTEDPAGFGVDDRDPTRMVDADDGVGCGIEQGAKLGVAPLRRTTAKPLSCPQSGEALDMRLSHAPTSRSGRPSACLHTVTPVGPPRSRFGALLASRKPLGAVIVQGLWSRF